MRGKLNLVDVRILEGLAEYGPRNIKGLAERLSMPRTTVISRINRMSSLFYLRLLTTVYHTNLGMKKAVVFAKAALGKEDLLFNYMKANGFYIYLSRCFGMFEGCIGIYVIPKEHTTDFECFIHGLRESGAVEAIEMLWSTCFHTVNLTTRWFDTSCERWVFPWEKWVEEIFLLDGTLPYTLKDPESYALKADETDLFIIKELEKDATISLTEIAGKLNTTLQNVHYHYQMHVLGHGLIEAFQTAILAFERTTSEMLFFVFEFDSEEKMAKFARFLLDKAFVTTVGKVLGQNALVAQFYLPRAEFRNFVDALSKLVRADFLKNYRYLFQDLRSGKWSRETIPFQFFKNGSWDYDHNMHVRNLHELMKKSCLERSILFIEQ